MAIVVLNILRLYPNRLDLPPKWKKLTHNERRVRKRAKYSGIDRDEARTAEGVKSAADTMPAGDRLSMVLRVGGEIYVQKFIAPGSLFLIDILGNPVQTMEEIGWHFILFQKSVRFGPRSFPILPPI